MSILIQAPELGLSSLLQETMLDPRSAGEGTKNITYQWGYLKTPYGFAKLDLTTSWNDKVLHILPFKEFDDYDHLIAVSGTKIREHDAVNAEWDDITQSGLTMSGSLDKPVSYVTIAHDDTAIYIDDDTARTHAYYHVIVCNSVDNIQRWAGRYETDFADLKGGGGYHDGTTHRAIHVGAFQSRLILLSPQEYDSAGSQWIENNQRIRWPVVSKIETWTGTGSGFADLVDTGGINVWAAPLGLGQYIVYQDNSVWSLNYIGGDDVFDPVPIFPSIGLLAPHLFVNYNNVHFFVGSNYNIYAYYGGSVLTDIGAKIQKLFKADIETNYLNRCWMTVDVDGNGLWVFIVASGGTCVTKAYYYNFRNLSWTVRDFAHVWSSTGITAVNLIGAQTYTTGDTYRDALLELSPYDAAETTQTSGDVTKRYGDYICTTTALKSICQDCVLGSWCAGGVEFVSNCAGATFKQDFTVSNVVRVKDGSKFCDATYVRYGTHYYTISDISNLRFVLWPRDTGVAVCNTAVYEVTAGINDISFQVFDPTGTTYRQKLTLVNEEPQLVIGDETGYIYMFSADETQDNNINIPCVHKVPGIDLGQPSIIKRWPGIFLTAKGDTIKISYKIDNGSWTDFTTVTLNTNWSVYNRYINKTGRVLYLDFSSASGGEFYVKEFGILDPAVLENR